jgi:hypothetical protein
MNQTVSRRRNTTSRLLPIALAGLLAIAGCSAEELTGIIDAATGPGTGGVKGFVYDAYLAPVSGASVKVMDGSQVLASTTTSSTGEFLISSVENGTHSLEVTRTGFNTASISVGVLKDATTTKIVNLTAATAPTAASVAVRVISVTSSALTFEVDVAPIASTGSVASLTGASYSISSFTSGGRTLSFALNSATTVTTPSAGPYAALFMMDQSGSIASTDPGDSRLSAAKAFMSKVGSGDRVRVGAFSSGGSLPFTVTLYGQWNSIGSSWYSTLDAFSSKVGGGTPLYRAIGDGINEVANNGALSNRALIVFTDGEDTDGGYTIEQLVSLATSRGVKLWTVGLQLSSAGSGVLTELAARTGGGSILASDARQLVSSFGTLGAMLNGGVTVARTRWTASMVGGTFNSGSLWSSVRVTTPEGTVSAPFYVKYP